MKLNQEYSRKRRTRAVLIESALSLMGDRKGLEALSLREVAKKSELAPAAFYRHFKNMEELGLALVDDVSLKLRAILRDARREGYRKTTMRVSVQLFFDYVKKNRDLFRFIVREKTGGNPVIRSAIRKEMNYFSRELAQDMNELQKEENLILFLSDFVITTSFNLAGDFLDLAPSDHKAQKALIKKAILQLGMIYRAGLFQDK